MTRLIVHVIDDDAAMRDSLAFLLDVNGFDARLHESAAAFLDAQTADTDCVLTDVRMPEMTGLDLVRRLREDGRRSPVVIMTGHGDVALAVEAMKAGVVDFIEKPFSDDVLVAALRNAFASIQPEIEVGETRRVAEARLSTLSPRERDVLEGVVAGKLNKVIAFELEISPRTVDVYRANLMAKTGARTMADLMRLALAAGL
ncbi:MAG: response regulator [Brevundimonas sp.]|nr:MAG: response regulator [Brevundimonas sp.]